MVAVSLKKKIAYIKDLMARTSQLLSELTAYMGLIMGIFQPDTSVESIKIFQLEGQLGLVVVNLSPGVERKVYIEFPKRYRDEVIHSAELMINERVSRRSLWRGSDERSKGEH